MRFSSSRPTPGGETSVTRSAAQCGAGIALRASPAVCAGDTDQAVRAIDPRASSASMNPEPAGQLTRQMDLTPLKKMVAPLSTPLQHEVVAASACPPFPRVWGRALERRDQTPPELSGEAAARRLFSTNCSSRRSACAADGPLWADPADAASLARGVPFVSSCRGSLSAHLLLSDSPPLRSSRSEPGDLFGCLL